MDLSYPADAEAFRTEIRTWLEQNLPAGWIDAAHLQKLAAPLAKNGYGQYLLRILEEKVF